MIPAIVLGRLLLRILVIGRGPPRALLSDRLCYRDPTGSSRGSREVIGSAVSRSSLHPTGIIFGRIDISTMGGWRASELPFSIDCSFGEGAPNFSIDNVLAKIIISCYAVYTKE